MENDPHWVSTRQWNATGSGFQVALEEDEAQEDPHGAEVIGWLAMEPGSGTWDGHAFPTSLPKAALWTGRYGTPWRSEAVQTGNAVVHNWYALGFAGSYSAPRFVASRRPGIPGMATYSGKNNCELRYRNLAAGGVEVKVEEDTTWDTETLHWKPEAVAYLALEGDGLLTAVSGVGGDSETSYYYLGGQRVAMRQDGVLYFIVGDHLASTSAVFDAGGSLHSQSRHYPYGTERWAAGTVPTDYRAASPKRPVQSAAFGSGAGPVHWADVMTPPTS